MNAASTPSLSILGTGIYLPPVRSIHDVTAELGADSSTYRGWENILIAEPDDHPSTMGAAALRQAIADSGVDPAQLRMVIFAGMSRDYMPSWSVATEIMSMIGTDANCVGLDMTYGCLGVLAGLNTALGWLAQDGGGYAAIVTAERWSYTVDRSREEMMGLWGHSDGAGALIVGLNVPEPALGEYRGACFWSYPDDNGRVLIRYGGTREPVPPPGETPFHRELRSGPFREVRDRYIAGYTTVLDAVRDKYAVTLDTLVLNQVSPGIVHMIGKLPQLEHVRSIRTGGEYGHVGTADIVIGLRRAFDGKPAQGPIAVAASTPYAYGAGLITAP